MTYKPDHKIIFLVPDDEESWLWCEDPTPDFAMEESEAIKYVRADELTATMKILRQTLLEVRHAQNQGSDWYTKGSTSLFQQVRLHLNRAGEAIKSIESDLNI